MSSPSSLCSPDRVRLAIYFHAKKRAQFLLPLFPQREYALSEEEEKGNRTIVEVVVIEEDKDIEEKVRERITVTTERRIT